MVERDAESVAAARGRIRHNISESVRRGTVSTSVEELQSHLVPDVDSVPSPGATS